jgi:hypothetical protein
MSSYELKDTGHGHGRPVQIVSRLPDQISLFELPTENAAPDYFSTSRWGFK